MKNLLFGKPLRFLTVSGALLFSPLMVCSSWGQETAVQEPPVAQEEAIDFKTVIADFIEVTGGEVAHKAIKSVQAKGKMSMPAFGLEGDTNMTQKEGKGLMVMNLAGVGEIRMGFDGETAWQITEMTGPEIMDGEQKAQFVMQMDASPMLNLEKSFDKVTCTGVEDFNGDSCHVIVCEKEGNYPVTHYFSVKSKLHVGTTMTAVSPQGEFESTSRISDYRDVNGVKMPFKTEADLPNSMVMLNELESIESNADIADSLFDLPEEIKALKSK